MGICSSKDGFSRIGDNFETWEQLEDALRKHGLESSNLLVAIDFTKSNTWQGRDTFDGKCLHHLSQDYKEGKILDGEPGDMIATAPPPQYDANPTQYQSTGVTNVTTAPMQSYPTYQPAPAFLPGMKLHRNQTITQYTEQNPYEFAISMAKVLGKFDDDHWIPTVVFGDVQSGDQKVRSISSDRRGSFGITGVLDDYRKAASQIYTTAQVEQMVEQGIDLTGVDGYALSGPTSFAPAVEWASDVVRESGNQYHILLIIGDGCVSNVQRDAAAIVAASRLPLEIVFVGVGDGDSRDEKNARKKWQQMQAFDDELPNRMIDNWQSVYMTRMADLTKGAKNPIVEFALHMLMEAPFHYKECKRRGLLGR